MTSFESLMAAAARETPGLNYDCEAMVRTPELRRWLSLFYAAGKLEGAGADRIVMRLRAANRSPLALKTLLETPPERLRSAGNTHQTGDDS